MSQRDIDVEFDYFKVAENCARNSQNETLMMLRCYVLRVSFNSSNLSIVKPSTFDWGIVFVVFGNRINDMLQIPWFFPTPSTIIFFDYFMSPQMFTHARGSIQHTKLLIEIIVLSEHWICFDIIRWINCPTGTKHIRILDNNTSTNQLAKCHFGVLHWHQYVILLLFVLPFS